MEIDRGGEEMSHNKPIYKGTKVIFDGIEFDSKLEATWYQFFKSLGWHVECYPDFPGRGYYIPDFLIIGKTRKILVEIKPLSAGDFTKSNQFYNAAIRGCNKINWEQADQAGITDFLIFGLKFDVISHDGGAYNMEGISPGHVVLNPGYEYDRWMEPVGWILDQQYDLADHTINYTGKVYNTDYSGNPVEIHSKEYNTLNYLWNQAVTDLKYNHDQRSGLSGMFTPQAGEDVQGVLSSPAAFVMKYMWYEFNTNGLKILEYSNQVRKYTRNIEKLSGDVWGRTYRELRQFEFIKETVHKDIQGNRKKMLSLTEKGIEYCKKEHKDMDEQTFWEEYGDFARVRDYIQQKEVVNRSEIARKFKFAPHVVDFWKEILLQKNLIYAHVDTGMEGRKWKKEVWHWCEIYEN